MAISSCHILKESKNRPRNCAGDAHVRFPRPLCKHAKLGLQFGLNTQEAIESDLTVVRNGGRRLIMLYSCLSISKQHSATFSRLDWCTVVARSLQRAGK